MIILVHVLIALSSVAAATISYFKPATKRFYASYGLILATIASGTYLIVSMQSNILRSCLTGLLYVTVVSAITVAAHGRARTLAAATAKSE